MSSELGRLTRTSLLLGVGLLLVALNLFRITVLQREQVENHPYHHGPNLRAMADLMERPELLIVSEEDDVSFKDAASRKAFRKEWEISERRMTILLAYVRESGGALSFDRSAVRQSNPRLFIDLSKPLRGRIFDRAGLLLAGPDPAAADPRTARRVYPMGASGFPLVGISHPSYGEHGLERSLGTYLSGEQRGDLSHQIQDRWERAHRGADVHLTLDARLQREVFALMAGRRGAVVLLSLPDFEIRVAVSAPAFDPATPAGRAWDRAANRDKDRPFTDRALRQTYFPGSTFKVAVAAAHLQGQPADQRHYSTNCLGGRHRTLRIGEHGRARTAHGKVDLTLGLAVSCNHMFGELAAEMKTSMLPTFRAWGLDRRLELGTPTLARRLFTERPFVFSDPGQGKDASLTPEAEGEEPAADPWQELDRRRLEAQGAAVEEKGTVTDDPLAPRPSLDAAWFALNPGVTAQGGIGQNVVRLTPLHAAMIAATVANGGVRKEPRLIASVRRAGPGVSGRELVDMPEAEGQRVFRRDVAAALQVMMRGVVTSPRGTGRGILGRAKVKGLSLAGKTGTAEVGKFGKDSKVPEDRREPHSWFIGFAPAETPRYAVAVILENAGGGSRHAGPLAAQTLSRALELDAEAKEKADGEDS